MYFANIYDQRQLFLCHFIVLTSAPAWLTKRPVRSKDCAVKGKVTFKCPATGHSKLRIRWLKNGKPFLRRKAGLVGSDASDNDVIVDRHCLCESPAGSIFTFQLFYPM